MLPFTPGDILHLFFPEAGGNNHEGKYKYIVYLYHHPESGMVSGLFINSKLPKFPPEHIIYQCQVEIPHREAYHLPNERSYVSCFSINQTHDHEIESRMREVSYNGIFRGHLVEEDKQAIMRILNRTASHIHSEVVRRRIGRGFAGRDPFGNN